MNAIYSWRSYFLALAILCACEATSLRASPQADEFIGKDRFLSDRDLKALLAVVKKATPLHVYKVEAWSRTSFHVWYGDPDGQVKNCFIMSRSKGIWKITGGGVRMEPHYGTPDSPSPTPTGDPLVSPRSQTRSGNALVPETPSR
jgi:hypothetical protein